MHGTNDFRERRWGGPAPPRGHGTHHYRFRLYALDAEPKLAAGATRAELDRAMEGHVLAEAALVGTYRRTERDARRPPVADENRTSLRDAIFAESSSGSSATSSPAAAARG